MNWEAIGAIAEALGAIGVIGTVVYIALQIRQNSEVVQGSTEQALMSQEMAFYTLAIENANVWGRGRDSMEGLNTEETIIFENLVAASMSLLNSAFVQYRRGLIPESVWVAYMSSWTAYRELAGFQQAWKDLQHAYPLEFRNAIDDTVNSNTGES
jgi:hypothetical protein